MEQYQTQTKALIATSQNEKLTVTTSRPLALNGQSKESKHNLERPVETESSDLLRPTAGKERLPSYHCAHQQRSSFVHMGGRGSQWYMEWWDNGK